MKGRNGQFISAENALFHLLINLTASFDTICSRDYLDNGVILYAVVLGNNDKNKSTHMETMRCLFYLPLNIK